MIIQNKIARGGVAISCGIFTGLFEFIQPVIMLKLKRSIKIKINDRYESSEHYISRRLFKLFKEGYDNDAIKDREILKVGDLGLEPGIWYKGEYYIEEHNSSNLHNDFSIVVNRKCYRMARSLSFTEKVRRSRGYLEVNQRERRSFITGTEFHKNRTKGYLGIFPGIGEKVGWVLQPEHLPSEVPNPSFIEQGYGAGTTKIVRKANCYVQVSKSGHLHIIPEGSDLSYVIIETKDNQALVIPKVHEGTWYGKHQMIDDRDYQRYISDDNYWFFEKKDGAAVEWKVVKTASGDKHLQIFSWRPDAVAEKRYGVRKQIDHTYRLHICDKPLPDDFPIVSGRGEIWCGGEQGLEHTSSILNSHPYRARSLPWRPYLYVHDIVEYEGGNVKHLPYDQKLQIMENLHDKDLRFKIPPYAKTQKGKVSLWKVAKKEPSVDGVIAWNINDSESKPVKLKFKHGTDHWHAATIVDIEPQKGEKGRYYSYPILENKQGIRFKSSGLGLTNEMKSDMSDNPNKYIGLEVRYSAEKHFDSGTPFQPVIKEINS